MSGDGTVALPYFPFATVHIVLALAIGMLPRLVPGFHVNLFDENHSYYRLGLSIVVLGTVAGVLSILGSVILMLFDESLADPTKPIESLVDSTKPIWPALVEGLLRRESLSVEMVTGLAEWIASRFPPETQEPVTNIVMVMGATIFAVIDKVVALAIACGLMISYFQRSLYKVGGKFEGHISLNRPLVTCIMIVLYLLICCGILIQSVGQLNPELLASRVLSSLHWQIIFVAPFALLALAIFVPGVKFAMRADEVLDGAYDSINGSAERVIPDIIRLAAIVYVVLIVIYYRPIEGLEPLNADVSRLIDKVGIVAVLGAIQYMITIMIRSNTRLGTGEDGKPLLA